MTKKILLILSATITLLLTLISGITLFKRIGLPYEEGRYFDDKSGIVYHEQAKEVWRICTLILLIVAILLLRKIKKVF